MLSAAPVEDRRVDQIVRASVIGIIVNAALAVLQIGVGAAAGSHAVVGSGLDSAMDIVTSLIILITARISTKPPDSRHPYGHGRAETIATKALSFVIFFAGVELAFTTALHMIRGESYVLPDPIALLPVFLSLVAKPALAVYKRTVGRRVASAMLLADAKNMINDMILAAAVVVGLALSLIFDIKFLDSVLAIGVSLWIIKVAFTIFWETNTELMEGIDDASIYQRIFSAVSAVRGAHHPHRTRVRKLNTLYVVDIDVEVDGSLTVAEGHDIGKRVERSIKSTIDNIYDVIVHIEPVGNVEREEKYGLSRRKLSEQGTKQAEGPGGRI